MTKKEFEAKIEEMEQLYCIKSIEAEIYRIKSQRLKDDRELWEDNYLNKHNEIRAVVQCLEIMTLEDGQEIQERLHKQYKLDTFQDINEAKQNGLNNFEVVVYNNNTFSNVTLTLKCYTITELIYNLFDLDAERFGINSINNNIFTYGGYIFIK